MSLAQNAVSLIQSISFIVLVNSVSNFLLYWCASVTGIILLLSKDFIRTVLVAIIIASPVVWYIMHLWLQDFAYRIDISW